MFTIDTVRIRRTRLCPGAHSPTARNQRDSNIATRDNSNNKGHAVPSGRLSRFTRFGTMATAIGGNMLLEGARRLAEGERPKISDMLLTPKNAIKLTNQLANLRGAAMKMGQMLSMDASDVLPPELADILAKLRADAQFMPRKQLLKVLSKEYGPDWNERFSQFDQHPIAAASIGQVHRAIAKNGRELAIKIQYPGVRESIDSDVDNVATLIKLSGIVPKSLNIAPMLAEAKIQLHQEADYQQEAAYLKRFGKLLKDDAEFQVPKFHKDLSTDRILAMTYIDSIPIESLITAPQKVRDKIITLLFTLLLRELFEFGLMQTDPNFANYRYNEKTKQLVLLDFGAARAIPKRVANQYRKLMIAGVAGDRKAAQKAAIKIGLFDGNAQSHHQDAIMDMFEMAMAPLRKKGPIDFADNGIAQELRDEGMRFAAERDFWHIPPVDTVFIHRKFGGVYMLANRLKAKVDIVALLKQYM
ncbi:MAG: AarF/ABC1/UbiB kinase family protein [Parasphingorhabdus sp.]|uniref:ABC1 kinase family protein n=1 Tax=Parasphingorhabdus sp. TaxID=2709688 RepID=UPI0032983910